MRGEETEGERGSFCREQRAALFRPIVGRCPGRAARGAGRGAVGTGGGLGTRPHRDVTEGGEPLAVPSPRARSSARLWSASPKRAGRRCCFGHRPRGARTARAGSVSRRPPIRFPCCRLPREVPPALTQRRTSPKAPELRPKLPRAHRLLSQRDPQAPERAPSLRPGQRAHLGHPWGGPLAPTAPPSGVRSRPCRRTWGLRTGEPLRVEGRRVSRGRWRVRQRAGPAGRGRCAPRLG